MSRPTRRLVSGAARVRADFDVPATGLTPEGLVSLAATAGWHVDTSWAAAYADGGLDVLVRRNGAPAPPIAWPAPAPASRLANDPLATVIAAQLAPQLEAYLAQHLPDYLVPSAVVLLDRVPLTANGKVDRRALPAPSRATSTQRVAPRSATEMLLVDVWREVLATDAVGVTDNFFDLGGHSLTATRVVSRIGRRCDVDLPVQALFECPTIEALAVRVEALLQARRSPALAPAPRRSPPCAT